MPFGEKCEFANFAACVRDMTGKVDDPSGYCADLMRRTEKRCRKSNERDAVAAAFQAGIRLLVDEHKAAKTNKIVKILNSFDWAKYHETTSGALSDAAGLIITTQGARAADEAGGKFRPDDPFVKKHMTGYVGDRIFELDDTTKADVTDLIRNLVDASEEMTTAELGDKIAELVQEKFDGYADWRADRIARTETSILYNYGTAFGYKQSGVSEVTISDGDEDEDCARVDGTTQTLEWFLENPIAHPNCERDASPVLPGDEE